MIETNDNSKNVRISAENMVSRTVPVDLARESV